MVKPKKYSISKGHSVEVWFYGTCKNPQSNRTISIGDTLIKALKQYKNEQEEYKQFYGVHILSIMKRRFLMNIQRGKRLR